jgi:hypothetical protein
MQQIGHQGSSPTLDDYKRNLFEREDDWSSATFWYAEQLAPLPRCLTFEERVANLPKVKEIVGSE